MLNLCQYSSQGYENHGLASPSQLALPAQLKEIESAKCNLFQSVPCSHPIHQPKNRSCWRAEEPWPENHLARKKKLESCWIHVAHGKAPEIERRQRSQGAPQKVIAKTKAKRVIGFGFATCFNVLQREFYYFEALTFEAKRRNQYGLLTQSVCHWGISSNLVLQVWAFFDHLLDKLLSSNKSNTIEAMNKVCLLFQKAWRPAYKPVTNKSNLRASSKSLPKCKWPLYIFVKASIRIQSEPNSKNAVGRPILSRGSNSTGCIKSTVCNSLWPKHEVLAHHQQHKL